MTSIQFVGHGLSHVIEKRVVGQNVVLGTTSGLAKTQNEDVLGCRSNNWSLRICLADGHWGGAAAQTACRFWLEHNFSSLLRQEAVKLTRQLEQELFVMFGRKTMDPDRDFTPETSFVAAELRHSHLHIISYGDCRLVVVRQGKIHFQLKTRPTWLGAFSHLKLRSRQAVGRALVVADMEVRLGDVIVLFSDGVDECVYEKPTISLEYIAEIADQDISLAFDALMGEIFAHGAEDNASIAFVNVVK